MSDFQVSDGVITCPACGEEYEDTDYLVEGDLSGDMGCEECGAEFKYEADFTTTWTTTIIERESGSDG